MYRVAISNSVYWYHPSFMAWQDDVVEFNYYWDYIKLYKKPELEYVDFISEDNYLDDISEQEYDILYGSKVNAAARFRIFHFKSEAHFTWFLMVIS